MKFFLSIFATLSLALLFTSCSSDEGTQLIQQEVQTVGLTIEIEGDNLFFGEVVYTQNVTKTIIISNPGNSVLNITSISMPDSFSIDWSSGSIASDASQKIKVTFSPDKIAEFQGVLEITSNADQGAYTSVCKGKGISDVYSGNISFQTDAQIEEFANKGYTSITGELCIGRCYDDKFFDTRNVTTLSPLSTVESVETLIISHCNELTTLDGIQQMNVAKQLQVNNCASLLTIDELPELISIPSISIFSNNLLQNINGLQNLESALSIGILNNASLTNIDGLLKLTEISFLRVFDNPLLENIEGLKNVQRIENELYIGDNESLKNLDPLENVVTIGERITIDNLPLITNLSGLRNVLHFDGVLSIKRNQLLNNYCDVQTMFQSASSRVLNLNRYNPSNIELSSGFCEKEVPLNVYDLSIVLRGKKELDYFLGRGYEIIEGDFILLPSISELESKSIKSIDGLGLKKVLGNLELRELDIINLEGLNQLENVSGNLIIQDNPNLSDFCALTTLVENSDFPENYMVFGNTINPSVEELLQGNCN